jgi:hypothetical protein
MKKYYYKLNSNKKKGKYGDFSYIKSNMAEYSRSSKVNNPKREQQSMQSDHVTHQQQSLYQETTSKFSLTEIRTPTKSPESRITNHTDTSTRNTLLTYNLSPARRIGGNIST